MMPRARSVLFRLSAVAALATAGGCADAANPDAGAGYVVLDGSVEQLRLDFNRARGSVRLMFVVDPICPGCLRGLDDINRSLLAETDDARLQTFVVNLPVLGAEAKDIAPAAKLLENRHVRQYWNPGGEFGRMLAEAVGLRRGDEVIYAWDVWLIYGPEAAWEGELPPRPQRLMHQLRALKDSREFPRLDSDTLAREARELLAGLPEKVAAN